jgi:hypothetical protein
MIGKSIMRKLSLFLSVSAGILAVSKIYWGNPLEPQEDE